MLRNNTSGFSFVEILMSTMILVTVIVGILVAFLRYMELNEVSENSSTAVNAVKRQVEQIRNTTFDDIFTTYNNTTFTDADITGMGVIYIDNSDPTLLQVTVSFSWQQRNGRVYGEDADLDGQIDSGEDVNGNSQLDSPVTLTSFIYQG